MQRTSKHIARHGITSEEAEQVIENGPLNLKRQIRAGEERTVYLGETDAGRILTVVVTARGEMLRVVTAHPADRSARRTYALEKGAQYGEDA